MLRLINKLYFVLRNINKAETFDSRGIKFSGGKYECFNVNNDVLWSLFLK